MTNIQVPYSAYRPSGIPWLGDIPGHWDVRRIKTLFREKDERNPDGSGELLSLTRLHGLIPQRKASNRIASIEDLSNYKICRPGDLVMNRMQAWSGMFATPSRDGVISPDYCVFELVCESEVEYFERLFKTSYLVGQFAQKSRGIGSGFNRLYTEDFGSIAVPVPPLPEQAAIVRYLDHEDERIRRYVSAKERLIGLLEEEKNAIVNRSVTRGLDPNVPLKPSGVEWLGDIPEHWQVSRVKSEFLSLNNRRVPLSAVERGAMKLRRFEYYGASGVIDKVQDYIFDDEVLLIAEDGANLVLRNLPLAIIARGKFWVNNHAHVLKPRRGNLGFLAAVMEGLNYTPWISGAAQPKLTQERLFNISIAVPPKVEQDEIIAKANEQTNSMTLAIEHARRQIALMQEYRARIIADVVTGKLDVRGEEVGLPDEAGALKPLREVGEITGGHRI